MLCFYAGLLVQWRYIRIEDLPFGEDNDKENLNKVITQLQTNFKVQSNEIYGAVQFSPAFRSRANPSWNMSRLWKWLLKCVALALSETGSFETGSYATYRTKHCKNNSLHIWSWPWRLVSTSVEQKIGQETWQGNSRVQKRRNDHNRATRRMGACQLCLQAWAKDTQQTSWSRRTGIQNNLYGAWAPAMPYWKTCNVHRVQGAIPQRAASHMARTAGNVLITIISIPCAIISKKIKHDKWRTFPSNQNLTVTP